MLLPPTRTPVRPVKTNFDFSSSALMIDTCFIATFTSLTQYISSVNKGEAEAYSGSDHRGAGSLSDELTGLVSDGHLGDADTASAFDNAALGN